MEDFEHKVTRFADRVLGTGAVSNLHRLSGGANMESWSFDHGGKGYVLRLSPSAELMADRMFGHDVEAALVRAAFAAGVKSPEVMGDIATDDDLGTGYLMHRVEAEVGPAKILADPPPSLLVDLARELALIHAIPLDDVPLLPVTDASSLLADLRVRFLDFGGDRPVMALTLRWLQDRLPPPVEPVLLHGDFRMGNIMADATGLAAVLDWELAHIGDRHQDLAYGCINSWRFGRIDRPAFGLGSLEKYWLAYTRESRVAVDAVRFRWWLIYSTLWWGVCCLQMAHIWRSGMDAGLERVVIGRRASETEVDLLMLLEEDSPDTEKVRHPELVSGSYFLVHSESKMLKDVQHDAKGKLGEPSAAELLKAIAAWIESDIKPHAEGRDKFMASVALNALGMLQREAAHPVEVHDKALADDLLAAGKSLDTPGLLVKLKAQSLAKLAADQPKYSALAVAMQKWSK